MNLFSLVLKQMRQRALGTWLTLLSVTLGVTLAITILILFREAGHLFGQTEFGYEVIVGKQGSATQLVMNTVYHVDTSPGNIPYSVYEAMLDPRRHKNPAAVKAPAGAKDIAAAVPIFVGDNVDGQFRMIGTTTNLFGIDDPTQQPIDNDHRVAYQGRGDDAKFYELAGGNVFAPNRFEAVIGSDVAVKAGLKIGSILKASHGEVPAANPDIYPEEWKVVGILKPTGTTNDGCVFVPLLSMYAAGQHSPVLTMKWAAAHDDKMPPPTTAPDQIKPYNINPDGTFTLYLNKVCWQVSAILVRTRENPAAVAKMLTSRDKVMAVDPAQVAARSNDPKAGCDLLVGNGVTPADLVIDTLDHAGANAGLVPYSVFESILPLPGEPPATTNPTGEEADKPFDYSKSVKIAIPITVGDTYQGIYRIIGTTTNMFGVDDETGKPLPIEEQMPYRPEDADNDAKYYEFADGHVFAPHKFEAIIGSEVAKKSDLKIGSKFRATHGEGVPVGAPDIHPEEWTVVGVLKPTHTANDSCVFIPILTDYTIEDHDLGLKTHWILIHGGQAPPPNTDPDEVHSYKMMPDGTFELFVPKTEWEVSAILVKTRGMPQALIYDFQARHDAMAVSPAVTMQQFFNRFLKPSQILLLVIALMVSIVAAIGILVSIYNSVAARSREIAIIRALGATRNRVLLLICTEAGLIGLIGSVTGLVAAHLVAAIASQFFEKYLGEGIGWYRIAAADWYYVAGITLLATLAGFVPAIKAYSTPVATNLVSS